MITMNTLRLSIHASELCPYGRSLAGDLFRRTIGKAIEPRWSFSASNQGWVMSRKKFYFAGGRVRCFVREYHQRLFYVSAADTNNWSVGRNQLHLGNLLPIPHLRVLVSIGPVKASVSHG